MKLDNNPGPGEISSSIPVIPGRWTLVDSDSAEDSKAVNKLQDKITVQAKSAKPCALPKYDMVSYKATLKSLLERGSNVPNSTDWFGSKADTTHIARLIGAAMGCGGLPEKQAYYRNVNPKLPVGECFLTAKDLPVRAFWSVSLYDSEGYFQKNLQNAHNFNSVNAEKNPDGSITIHCGGCADGRVNCLPVMEGWNYGIRMYEPEQVILDGSYVFPAVQSVAKQSK